MPWVLVHQNRQVLHEEEIVQRLQIAGDLPADRMVEGAAKLGDDLLGVGYAVGHADPVTAHTAGLWRVIQPEQLSRFLQGSGQGTPRNPADPAAILGTVGTDGVVIPGALTVAVWGFDSV